ncbi:MAG: hypothetical protein GY943_13490, partial [Chloroflexi bacterium]|nr:hypothetical protein [Chloroflexota bacterium]
MMKEWGADKTAANATATYRHVRHGRSNWSKKVSHRQNQAHPDAMRGVDAESGAKRHAHFAATNGGDMEKVEIREMECHSSQEKQRSYAGEW